MLRLRHGKFDWVYLIAIFPLLRLTWPWLSYRFNALLAAPFILLWFFLTMLRPVNSHVGINRARLFKASVCFISCVFLYKYGLPLLYGIHSECNRMSFPGVKNLISGAFGLIFVIHFIYWSFVNCKFNEFKMVMFLLFGVIIWTGIAGGFGASDISDVGSGRLMAGVSHGDLNIDAYKLEQVLELGMGGMNWIYESSYAIPAFVFGTWFCRIKWIKVLFFVCVCANYLSVRNGGLATPLMVVTIGLILFFVFLLCRSKIVTILLGITCMIVILIFSYNQKAFSFLSKPFRAAAEITEELPQFSRRFISMAETVEGNYDAYGARRYQLQQRSADSFMKGSLLFGSIGVKEKDYLCGGHSELLDCLAVYGFLGLFVLMLIWLSLWRLYVHIGRIIGGGKFLLGMSAIYMGTWIFASVPNPARIDDYLMLLLLPGIALFIVESRKVSEYGMMEKCA